MTATTLLLAKITTSVTMVVGLTLIAERVSPRVAGVLSGYPLGVAVALFFIGIENGADFAAASAVYTLAGFTASLVMVYVYYQVARHYAVITAATVSVLAFVATTGILRLAEFNLLTGSLITLGTMAITVYLLQPISNVKIEKQVRFSFWVLFIRAAATTAIILLITGLAARAGTRWAGVMSAFPITLFPVMLILHLTYGVNQVFTVIKNFPLGMGALLIYTATVAYGYPSFGVVWGTVLGFSAATGYLICLALVIRRQG